MREIRRARAGNGRMEENTRGPDDEAQKRTRKLRMKEKMADDNARGGGRGGRQGGRRRNYGGQGRNEI